MADPVEPLMRDMVAWLALGERRYAEVMEAWRTSCPRLPVWEDATDRGLLEVDGSGGDLIVRVTPAGSAFLREHSAAVSQP